MLFDEIKKNETINSYIKQADSALEAIGFTEHSIIHATIVAEKAGFILKTLGYDDKSVELAKIAGYLHDIGNMVNRNEHSQSGAIIAFRILDHMDFSPEDIGVIVSAIGNHDEGSGTPVSDIAAALILADKCDVRRNRVRNKDNTSFDIHDRVNYSVTDVELKINEEHTIIKLDLNIDTKYGSVMDYFEIFLDRMIFCRRAAEKLGLRFQLEINDQQLL